MNSGFGRWRWAALVREAVLNVLGSGSRQVLVVAVAACLGSIGVAFASYEWSRLVERLEAERSMGSATLLLSSTDQQEEVEIEIRSCEALSESPLVLRSGALVVHDERDHVAQLGPLVPIIGVSTQFVAELHTGGVVIGRDLVVLADGARLESEAMGTVTGWFGRHQPDRLGLNSAIAVPIDPALVVAPTCAVELERHVDVAAMEASLGAGVSADGVVRVQRLMRPQFDALADFRNRPGRQLPVALGVAGAVLAGLVTRHRYSEVAAYRLSGTSRADMLRLLLVEQAVCAGVYALSAVAATLVLMSRVASPTAVLGWSILGSCVWMAVYPIIVSPAWRGDPTALAKDR